MNKTVWKVGHTLSRRGLIDAACQMRDIAQMWDGDGYDGEAEALRVLDRLYYDDRSIDESLWCALRSEIEIET